MILAHPKTNIFSIFSYQTQLELQMGLASNQSSHLSNNILIIFQILINKLIQQNGTKKVQHMQRMQ